MDLKFNTTVTKTLTIKVGKFWGLIGMFEEVTEKKLIGSVFLPPS